MTCRVTVHRADTLGVVNDLCISSSSLGLALAELLRCHPESLDSSSTSSGSGVFRISVLGHRPGPTRVSFLKPYCSGLIVVHLQLCFGFNEQL